MLAENKDPNEQQQQMKNVDKKPEKESNLMDIDDQDDEQDFFTSKSVRISSKVILHDHFTQSSEQLQRNSHLQYSDLYRARMQKLAPCCRENSKKKWEKERECERIAALSGLIDSTDDDDEIMMMATNNASAAAAKGPSIKTDSAIAWVVGTVYVDLPLKECVLDEITREQWISAPPPRAKYVDPAQDKVIIEDESGRVVLSGEKLSRFLLCTGMVVGVLGRQLADGTFSVLDICFPLLEPQQPIPVQKDQQESYVAFVSGLEIGSEGSLDFKLQLFSDWITGELGDQETQTLVSKISRLVVLGNSLAPPDADTLKSVKNKFGRLVMQFDPAPLKSLDEFLSSLASGIDIDLMPGANDPTTHILPQRPILPSLLAETRNYSTLNCVTNPYLASIASPASNTSSIDMMCTSGQIVDDIYKYVPTEDRLAIATAVIGCGILSPTSPDTLWTSPSNEDTFIIKKIPHLFVVGNQPEFKSKLLVGQRGTLAEQAMEIPSNSPLTDPSSLSSDSLPQSQSQDEQQQQQVTDKETCRVVLVPKFSESGCVVLVNQRTLEVNTMYLSKKGQ